jgi:antitoxin component YwqK of YwqJK toxin-antitoxin module
MRKIAMLFFILPLAGFGQRVELKMVSYDVDMLMGNAELKVRLDSSGKACGPVRVIDYPYTNDTIYLFKGYAVNGFLVDTVYWYNTTGELIRKVNFIYSNDLPKQPECFPVVTGLFCINGYPDGEELVWTKEPRTGARYKKSVFHYRKGVQQGGQTEYYSNGKIEREYEFDQGEKNGPVKEYRSNGDLYYTGQYRQSKPIGEWAYYSSKDIITKKEWYSGIALTPDSVHEFYSGTNVIRVRNIFEPSTQNIHRYNYRQDGTLYKYSFYTNTGQESVETLYYISGKKLSEAHYINSEREGMYTRWYENGRIKESGKYEHNVPTGEWKQYRPDGKLVKPGEWLQQEEPTPIEVQETSVVVEELQEWIYVVELPQPMLHSTQRTLTSDNGLGFLKRYKTVRIQARLWSPTNIGYRILTPMKKKQAARLVEYLEKEYGKWSPLRINGKSVYGFSEMVLHYTK